MSLSLRLALAFLLLEYGFLAEAALAQYAHVSTPADTMATLAVAALCAWASHDQFTRYFTHRSPKAPDGHP